MRRIRLGEWQSGSLPFGSIFLVGLVAGILIMNFGKSVLLENTGLLDENTLYHMKYMTVDSNALFCYVLQKRLGSVLVLGILATTYLGLAVCVGTAFWYGMSAGAFLAALTIRYGIKGIIFAMVSVFPQYLLYAPALAALLLWCEQTNRSIYFRGQRAGEEGRLPYGKSGLRRSLPVKILKLLMIMGIVILGCMLEGFCNPKIMLSFLKIF